MSDNPNPRGFCIGDSFLDLEYVLFAYWRDGSTTIILSKTIYDKYSNETNEMTLNCSRESHRELVQALMYYRSNR